MADRYCKYCERENDDCLMRCAGWRDTAALRNQLQVKEIEHGSMRAFIAWLAEYCVDLSLWDDENGYNICEAMVDHGISGIGRVKYDPEIHGDEIDADPGTEIYYFDLKVFKPKKEVVPDAPAPVTPAE